MTHLTPAQYALVETATAAFERGVEAYNANDLAAALQAWALAVAAYDDLIRNRATQFRPDHSMTLVNWGNALADSGDGSYSATWVPNGAAAKVKVSFVATHRQLGTAATEVGDGVDMALHGAIANNPYPIRSVARWGTVNTLAPVLAGPLAPGSVATIYGTNLTDAAVSATTVPLPTELRGTRVRVGDAFAPLFFASPGQINFQIPAELTPGRQYPVTVLIAEAATIPEVISLVAA